MTQLGLLVVLVKQFVLMAITLGVVLKTASDLNDSRSSPPRPPKCIASCEGMPAGEYPSCNGCRFYTTCDEAGKINDHPCPREQVWDDNVKSCEYKSATCTVHTSMVLEEKPPTVVKGPTAPPPHVPAKCITNCEGMRAGDYKSCEGCDFFATCDDDGNFHDMRPCPAERVWDDNLKRCELKSATCTDEIQGSRGEY